MDSLQKILLTALVVAASLGAATPAFASADDALTGKLSSNWAGYAASGKYTAVGATWVVPVPTDATSSALATDATWVGIGGIKKDDLIQAGTQAVVQNGRASYSAWYELLPDYQRSIPLVVRGGDTIKVSMLELVPGLWHISFLNVTTGGDFEKTVEYDSTRSSADWIEEMPSVSSGGAQLYAPLDHFGSVTFTGAFAVASGKRKSAADTRADTITMVAKANDVVLARPGDLSPTGDSFTITRSGAKASPAPIKSGRHSRSSSPGSNIIWTK